MLKHCYSRSARLCTPDDQDWVKFDAQAGWTYTIETANLKGRNDTFLELYDATGTTRLRYDNNGAGGFADRITYTVGSAGTYYVRVGHRWNDGSPSKLYDLRISGEAPPQAVCVDAFEPNNTIDQWKSITLGTTQRHALCEAGDEDWVAFTGEFGKTYRIETLNLASGTNTVVEAYSLGATTTLVGSDDNSGGNGASQLDLTLSPRFGNTVIYVKVRHADAANGDPSYTYDLRIAEAPALPCPDTYEPDNSATDAKPVTLGSTQNRAFCVKGDTDWVKFTTTVATDYVIETRNVAPDADGYLDLYAADGTTSINSASSAGVADRTAKMTVKLAAATTYVVKIRPLRDYGNPRFTYDLRLGPAPCLDSYEPDGSTGEAKGISAGATQRRAFCADGDQDWVAFTGEAGTHYRIDTLNLATGVDTYLRLYASDGATQLGWDDNSGGGKASRLWFTPTSTGTYYIQATDVFSRGDTRRIYDLQLTAVACPDSYEPDGDVGQAKPIALAATQAHAFCAPGDNDWLAFQANAYTVYRFEAINVAAGTNPELNLYASNGTTLLKTTSLAAAGQPVAMEYTTSAAGTYYLKARNAYSVGNPTLTYDVLITAIGTVTPTPAPSPTATRAPMPTATPTPTPVPNRLQNPGFELDANGDGKPDSWTADARVTRSSAAKRSGSYAMRHYATDNSGYTISQGITGLTAGTAYTVGGYANIPSTSDTFSFKLEVQWRNSSNTVISTSTIKTYSAATVGWNQATANIVAPAGTTNAQIRMVVSSLNATVYVDDMEFRP